MGRNCKDAVALYVNKCWIRCCHRALSLEMQWPYRGIIIINTNVNDRSICNSKLHIANIFLYVEYLY